MTDQPTVEAFTVTGPRAPWPGRDVFMAAVTRGVRLFCAEVQREPTQREVDLLVGAVARHFSADHLLDPLLREQ